MQADQGHFFGAGEHLPLSSGTGEAKAGMLGKGVALDPKPAARKALAPIFFGVGGSLLKCIAPASPLHPAGGQAMAHEDLPARLKDGQIRPGSHGGSGWDPIGKTRLNAVEPANRLRDQGIRQNPLIEVGGVLVATGGALEEGEGILKAATAGAWDP
jgi:hypothetical protein